MPDKLPQFGDRRLHLEIGPAGHVAEQLALNGEARPRAAVEAERAGEERQMFFLAKPEAYASLVSSAASAFGRSRGTATPPAAIFSVAAVKALAMGWLVTSDTSIGPLGFNFRIPDQAFAKRWSTLSSRFSPCQSRATVQLAVGLAAEYLSCSSTTRSASGALRPPS